MNRREFVVRAVTLPLALRLAPEALAGGTPVALRHRGHPDRLIRA
jgi:hypothetical protein